MTPVDKIDRTIFEAITLRGVTVFSSFCVPESFSSSHFLTSLKPCRWEKRGSFQPFLQAEIDFFLFRNVR
jgi:hypothetical protein